MKLTSLAVLSLLAALSFAPPSLAASDPYVVSGVDYSNPWDSEFYFDSTKGSTLVNAVSTSVEPFIEAWKANATKTGSVMDLSFLGKWEERIDKNSTWYQDPRDNNYSPLTVDNIDAYAVQQLVSIIGTADFNSRSDKGMALDGNMCWAHTAANMLQYWQCYYGIFATNTSAMQHGYAVENADTAKTMLGVQSLNTTKWFYDHFTNNGADLSNALGWYLDYDANKPTKSLKVFDDYFSSVTAATTVKSVGTIEDLTKTVLSLMGVDKAADGTISTNTYGQLIGLNIGISGVSDTGHSLTMYGFGLGDDGQINRLIYADSNVANRQGLITVYVKENNGALVLYEDALCQKLLEGKSWQISNLMAINTPDSLRDMGRQYAEGDLVWMGGSTWKAGQGTGSMATAMPTDPTGWQVSVNGTYYNSYFDASRNVRFNDDGHEVSSTVSISGTATAHNMTIDAVSKDYTFNAANSGAADSIALAGDLIKSGAAKASFGLKISAAGLSVKGGTLAVGSGCTLTISGTSMIERGATLSVGGGGTASLGSATFAAGSVLSVSGTKNTLNASSLTFADGARLSFDLSDPETKNNVMLTLERVTPGFNGKVYFDFYGGDLNEKYKLIYFGSSVNSNCLDNFVSYNGDLSLDGNYLILDYKQEQTATWSGNTDAWSSTSTSQWSGTPEGASVTFDGDHEGTVTVSGTVNPAAINVTGGSYVFVSDTTTRGSISGSRDLIVSGTGTSLTAKLDLGARAVKVQDTASFVYEVADNVQLAGLEVASEASATFQGSGTYDVYNPSVVGSLKVDGSAKLALHSDVSVSTAIKLTMTEKASVQFRNTSNSGMVSYSLATDPSTGTINVGSVDDTFGTRLNVSSAATSYTIAKDSILSIGGATANFTASGEGTVLVDSDNSANLNLGSGGALSVGHVDVRGTATVNNSYVASWKEWDVSGTLNLTSTAKVELASLSLNGGTVNGTLSASGDTVSTTIGSLQVGTSGGTLSLSSTQKHSSVVVNRLEGSGSLNVSLTSEDKNGLIALSNVEHRGSLNFVVGNTGTGFIANGNEYNYYYAMQLGPGSIDGVLEMTLLKGTHYSANNDQDSSPWKNRGDLVIAGDVSLGGLDVKLDYSYVKTYNGYDAVRLLGGSYDVSSHDVISPQDAHTLRIKTNGDSHTFVGHIGSKLNITKDGSGTQEILGDLSLFDGSVDVQRGKLKIGKDIGMPQWSKYPGQYLTDAIAPTDVTSLHAKDFRISGDATFESDLTVKVSGAFEARAYVSDLVGAAEAATFALDDAVGTNATENPVATVNAALDLSGATSLTFETGVDLNSKALRLWTGSTKYLTLSRSMRELQDDGTYNVTLFKNVGSVDGLSSDPVDAATLFTSDNLTSSSNLVYDSAAKTIVLTSVTFDVPEPTTATLALLGLMGLCARRRRKKSASSN